MSARQSSSPVLLTHHTLTSILPIMLTIKTLEAGLLVGLASLAQAALIRGDATFTGNNINGGTCSFTNYTLPAGVSGVGIGPPNWANGTKCGACLQVNGPRGSVKVMVRSTPSIHTWHTAAGLQLETWMQRGGRLEFDSNENRSPTAVRAAARTD